MKNDPPNPDEELQTRREFFKSASKSVLPILGVVALLTCPSLSKAAEVYGCQYACSGSCFGSCQGTCSNTCLYTCYYGCKGSCRTACTYTCSGTSKGYRAPRYS